ncbi:hypothetical protein ACYZT4_06160 [Pseudomonas sp. GB2N2]
MPLHPKLTALALSVLLAVALPASSAQPNVKTCECEFSSRDYRAYGTSGACGVFMYAKASICEISFVGIGASSNVLDPMLGAHTLQAQLEIAPDIFSRYLEFVKTGEVAQLSEHDFIARSLPVMARASLFREAPHTAEAPIKRLDAVIQEVAQKYSDELEAIFLGKQPPHTLQWDAESDVELGRGYVQINYRKDIQLRVLYFSPTQR